MISIVICLILAYSLQSCGTGCVRCWLGNDTDYCYQCANGYIWHQKKCTPLSSEIQLRSIPGWGRECAECGTANYWSAANHSCMPCPYESGYCTEGFPCCNDDGPRNCTKSFELIDGKCKCQRGEGFRYKYECVCPANNTYTDGNGNCFECENRCHAGCEQFECGDGFYLEKGGCRCLPVHYSCKTGTGPGETECIICQVNYVKVRVGDYDYCYCDGCTIEINQVCVPVDPKTDSSRVCNSCPGKQFLYQNACRCIDEKTHIEDGGCLLNEN